MHYGKTRNHNMYFFRLLFPETQCIRGSLITGEMQEQLCTELFLIIQKLLKTLRWKTQKVQCEKALYTHTGAKAYIQLVFFFNSVLHNNKKMLNFYQTSLDQAVHCCNLLDLALAGELHVGDSGI